ncbi:hypothetical protein B7494_g8008 [Chlorociboria aeruginascens]|nr:hypothetical protein B7494_g8008 [Chlorociboria aeruginascens]
MAPSKAAAAVAPFAKDEKVLCFHHDMLYEAKVLDSRPTEDSLSFQYKIHYKGWKNTWDDWVPQDRVKKFTEENIELAAQMKSMLRNPKSAAKKGGRANGSDFSSRGSEERHPSVAAQSGRGGARRNRDYEVEQSSPTASALSVSTAHSEEPIKATIERKNEPSALEPLGASLRRSDRNRHPRTPPNYVPKLVLERKVSASVHVKTVSRVPHPTQRGAKGSKLGASDVPNGLAIDTGGTTPAGPPRPIATPKRPRGPRSTVVSKTAAVGSQARTPDAPPPMSTRRSFKASQSRVVSNDSTPDNQSTISDGTQRPIIKSKCSSSPQSKGSTAAGDALVDSHLSNFEAPRSTKRRRASSVPQDSVINSKTCSNAPLPSTATRRKAKDPERKTFNITTRGTLKRAAASGAQDWSNPKSVHWDPIKVLYSDECLAKDDLLQMPDPKYSYLDCKGRLKNRHKYAESREWKADHPKLAAHVKNGTDTSILRLYYKDMDHKHTLPFAGIIRDEPEEEPSEVRGASDENTAETDATFSNEKHRNNLTDQPQEENFHARPSIRLAIPDHIKAILVDDWENVTKNQQLVPIPSNHPVNSILADYLKYEQPKRQAGSAQADILEEVVAGLKEYFEKCLGRILLYRFERNQYLDVLQSLNSNEGELAGKTVGDTYGAEHLCRLLVTLPELIAQTNMDHQSVNRLREELTKMTNWLGKNAMQYFVSEYETPTQEYVEKARGV